MVCVTVCVYIWQKKLPEKIELRSSFHVYVHILYYKNDIIPLAFVTPLVFAAHQNTNAEPKREKGEKNQRRNNFMFWGKTKERL